MSSTNPTPDPFDTLIAGAKAQVRLDAEYTALAAKVEAGSATGEERLRFRFRPVAERLSTGTLLVGAKTLTLAEWNEVVALNRASKQTPG